MSKPNGGPAFPQSVSEFREYESLSGETGMTAVAEPSSGMSLRDYFAARVLASWGDENRAVYVSVNNGQVMGGTGMAERAAKTIAKAAYILADAMLAERNT